MDSNLVAAAEPLTVVARRRVKVGRETQFEAAMQEFIRFALSAPGHAAIHVLRPAAGSREYLVVDSFVDASSRSAFKASMGYRDWMRRLGDLTEGDVRISEVGGLAGWFPPPAGTSRPAPTYKMALTTFVGVYPLTSFLPPLVQGLVPAWHPLVANILVTALIVAALTWVIMPILRRLLASWLFS
jgi:antibiotic biosynthesis monooxygenase (ABM) superfamily enzyme